MMTPADVSTGIVYLKYCNNFANGWLLIISPFSAQPRLAWAMPKFMNRIWFLSCESVLITIFTPASLAFLMFFSFKSNLSGQAFISRIVFVSLATFKILSKSIWYSSLFFKILPVGWEIMSTFGFLIALIILSFFPVIKQFFFVQSVLNS